MIAVGKHAQILRCIMTAERLWRAGRVLRFIARKCESLEDKYTDNKHCNTLVMNNLTNHKFPLARASTARSKTDTFRRMNAEDA